MKRMIDRVIAPKDDSIYDIDGSNILEYGIIAETIEWWWLYGWNWGDINLRGTLYTLMWFLTFGGYDRYIPWVRFW